MLEDYQNYSMQKCKDLILEYQKSRNPKIFNILLARFDNYILFMINNYKKYVSFLSSENIQELYHTGIIGFHKGILSFKKHLSTKYVTLRIGSYVIAELRQTYRHKIKENIPIIEANDLTKEVWNKLYPSSVHKYNNQLNEMSCNFILSSNILEEDEKEYLKLKYFIGLTFKEIAKEKKVSYNVVYRKIMGALEKLRLGVRSE